VQTIPGGSRQLMRQLPQARENTRASALQRMTCHVSS
jgi:hypothetical protein